MKKYILFPVVLVALVLSSNMVKAQAEDVANPLLQYINKDKGIRFTAGARLFADVAYYHSEYTPMKSGAALTDARIRTSLGRCIFTLISIFRKELSSRRIFSCDIISTNRRTGFIA